MYIGNIPADKFQTLQKQSFTTSATDTYTLSYAVTNPQDLALFINNVRQNPNDAYTVSNTTLTLSSAITGSDTMYAVFLGRAVETIAPATGSVTNDMLAGSINESKLAGSIPNSKLSGPIGKTGQTIANHITTQTSSSSSSFADVGGSETTIVTTASSSKVLLHISLSCRKFNNMYLALDLYRKIGSGSYSKIRDFENGFLFTNSTATNTGRFAVSFLDEPASADTIKYKMQFNSGPNGASVVINPDAQETSSIILQEVLA